MTLALVALSCTALAAEFNVKAGPDVPGPLVEKVKQAAWTTAEFYEARFGLTLDRPVDIVLAASKEEYERALVEVLKFSPESAAKFAKHNKGVSSWHIVSYRLNGQSSERDIYMHIAHELTHTYQRYLATSRPPGKMTWLWEGMANVVPAQLVEIQGIRKVAETRRGWLDYARRQTGRPELKVLLNQQQWFTAMDVYGIDNVYNVATLAVDYLAERKGQEALFAYVRAARTATDGAAAFRQAFGMELEVFAAEFAGYLAARLRE